MPFNDIQTQYQSGTWKTVGDSTYGDLLDILDAMAELERTKLSFTGPIYSYGRSADKFSGASFANGPQILHVPGAGGISPSVFESGGLSSGQFTTVIEVKFFVDIQVVVGSVQDDIVLLTARAMPWFVLFLMLYQGNMGLNGTVYKMSFEGPAEMRVIPRANGNYVGLVIPMSAVVFYNINVMG